MFIVTYYTEGVYEEVFKSCLLPSLQKWDLPYIAKKVPDFGSWEANTGYKSEFILDMLIEHQEDICFIDSDARIVQYPNLLFQIPENFDLAYHDLNRFLHCQETRPQAKYELLTGTIIFRYNLKVLNLLNVWIKNVQREITTPEQLILQRIMRNNKDFQVFKLPVDYCAILRNNELPNYIKNPVIIHTQASRLYKNKIG